MSKQHTPITISKYIDREITDIRIKVYSGAPSDEIEHRLHGLNLYIIDKLGKVQNNHDRLVEALDTLVNTPNDGVYGDHYSAWVAAKQLLTELNK